MRVELIVGTYKFWAASEVSLLLRSLLLHGHLLLLTLLGLDEQLIGLAGLGLEVLVLSEKQLEVDCRLVKEHTSDRGRVLFSIIMMNRLVNMITDEVISVIARQLVELSNINWREEHLLWWR